jgi:adenosylhomocysteine nucleosidase
VLDKLTDFSFKKGLIVTGDSFVNSKEKIREIQTTFPDASAIEMEGAAIQQVCKQFGTACLIFRSISDTADGEATESFDEFIVAAGERSAKMVLAFLDELK